VLEDGWVTLSLLFDVLGERRWRDRSRRRRLRRECLHSGLSYKRLERGRFIWPQASDGRVVLTPAQLSMLLEGIDWRMRVRTQIPELAA
jgi:transposase